MTCHDRDQDLVLLVHDELRGLRRLLAEAHVRRCPMCQEKRAEYRAVSGLLATTIRGETMPPFKRRAPAPAAPLPGLARLSWPVAAALLLALSAAAAVGVMEVQERVFLAPPPPPDLVCPSALLGPGVPVSSTAPGNAPAPGITTAPGPGSASAPAPGNAPGTLVCPGGPPSLAPRPLCACHGLPLGPSHR